MSRLVLRGRQEYVNFDNVSYGILTLWDRWYESHFYAGGIPLQSRAKLDGTCPELAGSFPLAVGQNTR
jgi:hypothetical protein